MKRRAGVFFLLHDKPVYPGLARGVYDGGKIQLARTDFGVIAPVGGELL